MGVRHKTTPSLRSPLIDAMLTVSLFLLDLCIIIRLLVGGILMVISAVLWVAVGFQVGLQDSERHKQLIRWGLRGFLHSENVCLVVSQLHWLNSPPPPSRTCSVDWQTSQGISGSLTQINDDSPRMRKDLIQNPHQKCVSMRRIPQLFCVNEPDIPCSFSYLQSS